jgi:hypothetical protein
MHAHRSRDARAARTILDSVRRAILDTTPLPDGYAYRFDPTSEILSHLARLVNVERQCIPRG